MKRLLCVALITCGLTFLLSAQTDTNPITLQQALSTALSSGPDIKVAQLTLSNADAQLSLSRARQGFSVGASTAYSHEAKVPGSASVVNMGGGSFTSANLPGESASGSLSLSRPGAAGGSPATKVSVQGSYGIADTANADGTHNQEASVGISLSQTVYDGYPGGRAAATLQQAQYSHELAQVDYTTAKDNIVYTVEQSYFTMLGAQHTVRLRQEQLRQSQEDLARTNAYFKANRVTSLDVLTSRIAEQAAQANLSSAQNELIQDRSSLAVLLGWPIDKDFSVAEVTEPTSPNLSEQTAVERALANRAELKQFSINRANASVELKNAESQRMPVVSVTGGGSYNIYPGITPSANGGTWNAGVDVSVPIFDSGAISSQVAQIKDTISQIGIQEERTKQTITIDVRKSLFAVKDASVRLNLAKESVKQAQGEYNLEKTKFSAGLSSNLDVINASVTLANAQVSMEAAQTNLNLAILNLEKVMGTLTAAQ